MKKDRLLNPHILEAVASLGHTEKLCIADCGLPVPAHVPVIDISLTAGVPSFRQVLQAVNSELVSESYILAREVSTQNPELQESISHELSGLPCRMVSHEEFKSLVSDAKCVIRTGENSPYANIFLVGGVNF